MAPSNQHTAKTSCLDGMKIILSRFDLTHVTMRYYCLFHAAEVLIISLLQFLQFFQPIFVCKIITMMEYLGLLWYGSPAFISKINFWNSVLLKFAN